MTSDATFAACAPESADERLHDSTEAYLKSLIAEATGTVAHDVDARAAFGELGVNSFQVLKIIKRLETDFGRLPKSLLFENFNVHDLAAYFVAKHKDTLLARWAVAPVAPPEQGAPSPDPAAIASAPARHVDARAPLVMLEREAYADAQLGELLRGLFERHKLEGSVSRGTRRIAPQLFIGSARRGFFNFGRRQEILLLYGYTGPRDYLPELLEEVQRYCVERALQLNVFSDEPVPPVAGVGYSATPFGVLQRITGLRQFNLQGGPMRRLRYQVAAFQKRGACRTEEYHCGADRGQAERIVDVIERWCASRTVVNPLVHDVKAELLAGALRSEHRVFLTFLGDALQNVILIAPLCAQQNGYLMDLEFYPPDMPLGGLEFAIVEVIKTLAAEGCDVLSLGGTYGCKLAPSPSADPEIDRLLDELRQQNVFNDAGNLQFKNKFRPESRSVYLCRPLGSGRPENVVDVIMMIAQPEDAQPLAEAPAQAASPAPALLGPDVTTPLGACALVGNQRSQVLARHGFNPLDVPAALVDFDLRTDSWAQLELPASDARLRRLREQIQLPVRVDELLRSVFPLPHCVLTVSGQAAERAFFRAWPRRGAVLQNLLFPSTIFHALDNGFSNEELPRSAALEPDSAEPFKGDLDWEQLEARLARGAHEVACVCLDLCNNATGGQPVSLAHLRRVRRLLAPHGLALVLDATRVIENAALLVEREADCAGRSLMDVVADLLSCADVVVGSLTKDFCVPRGGIVAVRDAALFDTLRQRVHQDGAGLEALDERLVALSLKSRKSLEEAVLQRMDSVRRVFRALDERGVPLVRPAGGHCVLIDVARLPEFSACPEPVASFLAWLYLNTGVRAAAHGVGQTRRPRLDALVRLALPVGLAREHVEVVIARLLEAFARRADVPELALAERGLRASGEPHASYRLLAYRNASAALESLSATSLAESGARPGAERQAARDAVAPSGSADAPRTSPEVVPAPGPAVLARRAGRVAVIGMAGRYPQAANMHELWQNLVQGRDCITDLPADRHARRLRYGPAARYRGGFLDEVDRFDSLFFNISPREAELLDPQERLFLEVAWEALEDAGYYPESLTGEDGTRDVGVFVGAVWAMYQMLGVEERHAGHVSPPPNSFLWSVANRVSYWMNFSGPSLTVDTACSSSLTALYLACEALQAGDCSTALVGGVNLDLHQAKLDINLAGGALSPDGVCRSFGRGANGYVAGEGVGALLLKPLERALADGDNVQGVIRSVVANHGGRTSGYTVPNPKAQAGLILAALRKAEVDARSLGFIEAHGTGTALGDPIEIAGLSEAFEAYAVPRQSCAIGSVKSNMGHLEAAAGIVGVSKVLLQMQQQRLAPSLHSAELNELIDFASTPFYVVQTAQAWQPRVVDGVSTPLRAGVSSFGAGGSNAHVILERHADEAPVAEAAEESRELIFPLSARTEEQLRAQAARLADWLQRGPARLRDVAHTLQVGRKAFDHRLAVVARTQAELLQRLQGCAQGRAEDVAVGHVKSGEAATRLLDRREKQEFLRLLAQRRDARRLAQAWVEGLFSDWHGTHERAGRRRVSLPTYPFAGPRHWAAARAAPSPAHAAQARALHPLIDANESTFERQVFSKAFHERDFFIYDHRVAGVPTLPGVAYLELARKAGELAAAGRSVRKLRNVVWMSPIAVLGSEAKQAFIELTAGDELVRFEVASSDEQGQRVVHCQGALEYAPLGASAPDAEYVDLAGVRARCVKVNEGARVYPAFKSFGLDLGPSFQVLEDVYKGEHETLGVLALPACRADDLGALVLHPSLLDGSLQAGVGAQLGARLDEMFVPFYVGEVELLHPLPQRCYSYVTQSQSQSARVVKSDVAILDESGRVLIRIRESTGVPLRELHKQAAPAAQPDPFRTLYYAYDWQPAPTPVTAAAEAPGAVVLFEAGSALCELWRERLRRSGAGQPALVLVQPGGGYAHDGQFSYVVDADAGEDFSRVFEALAARGQRVDTVCFAWPVDADESDAERQIYGFLFLCQALVRHRLDGQVQLLYLSSAPSGESRPHDVAVDGFLKCLRLEHPRLSAKTLEVVQPSPDREELLSAVLAELRARAQDATAVRYEAGARHVRRLAACEPGQEAQDAPAPGVVVRRQGVYLITGGGGGLGLLLAEFLARTYDARLVLSGRSALSAASQARLAALHDQGASVVYSRADVCQRDDVERLVRECKATHGRLDGILHCAGVLRDSALRNKTRAEMSAVLAPKLAGTLHLDAATRDEPLELFVLFSSLTALGGNAGQCDYGFANRFLDAFAERRERLRAQGARSGRTLSLNWGLWAEGGMRVGPEVERFMRDKLGLRPLPTPAGLQAFERALAGTRAQIAVVEGLRERLEAAWGLHAAPAAAPAHDEAAARAAQPTPTSAARPEAARGAAYERIQHTIVEKLALVLQLEPAAIPHDAPFADFGVNSVMGVEMVRTINEALQIDLDPLKLFEYTTVDELSDHIWATRPQQASAQAPAAAPVAEPARPLPQPVEQPFARKERPSAGPAQSESRASRASDFEPVAVIGMSGRFAEAESLDELWEHLEAGHDLVRLVSRWKPEHSAMATSAAAGYCAHGSFVESIDRFDPSFFGISALEALWMDPQQRLFLEEAWRALEHAGYAGPSVQEKRCGVYVGCSSSNYERLFTEVPPAEVFWGNAEAVIPARIAYYLNLQGPALAVDTASSSSLVAVHLACQGLWAHETDMALAGGVFLQATPGFFQVTNRAGLLSPDGKCYAFDARANGFVPGEGVGVVVLKRLRDALRDGDHVHAVIAACAINQNGRSNGLIAPNARAQERLYRSAYERFEIDPESIQLLEANGTGTLLGDSIEYQALCRAFRQSTQQTGFCALGSIATNLGHAATAAGVAGLLKVLLALQHRRLPPSLHFERANPAIDFASGPFYVNGEARAWPSGSAHPRRGAVSSFGIGGTNAHVVVEQAPAALPRPQVDLPGYLVTLSARSAAQLQQQVRNLLAWTRRAPEPALIDVSFTLFVGRMHLGHRLACVARDRDELLELLSAWLAGGSARRVYVSELGEAKVPERASLTRFGNHCIEQCRSGAPAEEYLEHLTTVAELYAQGHALEFERLFPAGCRRVPLPTYPFADERYWIDQPGATRAAGAAVERQSDGVPA